MAIGLLEQTEAKSRNNKRLDETTRLQWIAKRPERASNSKDINNILTEKKNLKTKIMEKDLTKEGLQASLGATRKKTEQMKI